MDKEFYIRFKNLQRNNTNFITKQINSNNNKEYKIDQNKLFIQNNENQSLIEYSIKDVKKIKK